MLKLIECPRDAMQGMSSFIPTEVKASYINALLNVGFDTIDFGSFVSPKAIPQLRDTAEVLAKLNLTKSASKLLVIIGNLRGAEAANDYEEITYLGFPHAISQTFLKLNINSTRENALKNIEVINNLCVISNKELVVYLSLAFGNPYNESWNIEMLLKEIEVLKESGIKTLVLADTLGNGTKEVIAEVFRVVLSEVNDLEFGFHLHTTSDNWYEKVQAAYENGCRRFDSVILGLGGCPMSNKELVGNLSTENMLDYFRLNNIPVPLNMEHFDHAHSIAETIFK